MRSKGMDLCFGIEWINQFYGVEGSTSFLETNGLTSFKVLKDQPVFRRQMD
jgi:hypothetical protein